MCDSLTPLMSVFIVLSLGKHLIALHETIFLIIEIYIMTDVA